MPALGADGSIIQPSPKNTGSDRFDGGKRALFAWSPGAYAEAARIDPQQRLFLETTWEALQDAGIVPERLAGTKIAVYSGISSHGYAVLQMNPVNRYLIGGHTMTGITNCIVANRVSYLLDLDLLTDKTAEQCFRDMRRNVDRLESWADSFEQEVAKRFELPKQMLAATAFDGPAA
ncbi:beta-ketoacyl synthase N-terminal-like domain-containing protein [Nocardia sp. NPDC052566]|uniref:beta-ketoacyl synthase N-terminal-like domain-containing protein n=1 Tax=Nocardia sp. NPDC052566 TaxID=3364330 RepID=UPI0037C97724